MQSGDTSNYDRRGITPRALHRIFQEKELRPDLEMDVQLSCFEIYNDALHDLFASDANRDLSIGEENGAVKVHFNLMELREKAMGNGKLGSTLAGSDCRSVDWNCEKSRARRRRWNLSSRPKRREPRQSMS